MRSALVAAAVVALAACGNVEEHRIEIRAVPASADGVVGVSYELLVLQDISCGSAYQNLVVRSPLGAFERARRPLVGAGTRADPARLPPGEELPLDSARPTLVVLAWSASCDVIGFGCWSEPLRPDVTSIEIEVEARAAFGGCESDAACVAGRCVASDGGAPPLDAGEGDAGGRDAATPDICENATQCDATEDCCARACVDTSTSRAHCGSCGTGCAMDQVCVPGSGCARVGLESVTVAMPASSEAGTWQIRLEWTQLDAGAPVYMEIGGQLDDATLGADNAVPITAGPSFGTLLCARSAACGPDADPLSDACACVEDGGPQVAVAFVVSSDVSGRSAWVGYSDSVLVFSDRAAPAGTIRDIAFDGPLPAGFSLWTTPAPLTTTAGASIGALCAPGTAGCSVPPTVR